MGGLPCTLTPAEALGARLGSPPTAPNPQHIGGGQWALAPWLQESSARSRRPPSLCLLSLRVLQGTKDTWSGTAVVAVRAAFRSERERTQGFGGTHWPSTELRPHHHPSRALSSEELSRDPWVAGSGLAQSRRAGQLPPLVGTA